MQTAPENKISPRERLLDEFLATHGARELEIANHQAVRTRAAEAYKHFLKKPGLTPLESTANELIAKRDAAKAAYEAATLAAAKAQDVAQFKRTEIARKAAELRPIQSASAEFLRDQGLTTVSALEARFSLSSSAS